MEKIALLLTSLPDGLMLGFVYGVAAMGMTLIWGVMNVVNLAHGAMISAGMFGSYLVFIHWGFNPYVGLLVVAPAALLLGVLIYSVAVRPVIGASHLSSLLATFSVNMIVIGLGTAVFTTSPHNIDFSMGIVRLGPVVLPGARLMAALAAIVVAGGLFFFLYRSRSGREIRAVAGNRDAAELMGIATSRVLGLSFGIGTMLAAISGALIAACFPFGVLSGSGYELKSFVICVLGGMGSPAGALAGGLLLGVLESSVPAFMDTSWVPVIEFGLFIVVLLARPDGLFGRRR